MKKFFIFIPDAPSLLHLHSIHASIRDLYGQPSSFLHEPPHLTIQRFTLDDAGPLAEAMKRGIMPRRFSVPCETLMVYRNAERSIRTISWLLPKIPDILWWRSTVNQYLDLTGADREPDSLFTPHITVLSDPIPLGGQTALTVSDTPGNVCFDRLWLTQENPQGGFVTIESWDLT